MESKMHRFTGHILLCCSLLISPLLNAQSAQIESGNARVALIELFTSEGCSSCPPAEKYLNDQKHNEGLWKKIVPVAFHVDYWDYIGWKDRFAHPSFATRQSTYAQLARVKTVYTPAFLINGSSWRRGWFSQKPEITTQQTGNLVATINDQQLTVQYHQAENMPLILNVALLGMAVPSSIERGENAGQQASHDFVVIGYGTQLGTHSKWQLELPPVHVADIKPGAIAIWVNRPEDPTPLQSVGGYLN